MPHVIVTGPESTGKSTLAAALTQHFDGTLVPEYPRGFLQALGRLASAEDFAHFAAVNAQLPAAAKAREKRRGRRKRQRFVVQDTGAEVLHLWHEDKFGPSPEFLRDALAAQAPDVYLLCRPDLPWEYDPLREDPHRRQELFGKFRALLDARSARVFEVRGFDEERLAGVIEALRLAGVPRG